MPAADPPPPGIRVALIGFGSAGRFLHAPLISTTPGLTLAVIGSSQVDLVRSVYPAVEVADPLAAVSHPVADLVVIATPNDSHAPLAEAALRAGKHVVVDKPFTVTRAEARALTDIALETGRVLSVFQNRRWDSDFLEIAAAIAAGRIGQVVELRSEMSRHRPLVRDRWRERAGPGAGVWYDLGAHLIDQTLLLFGLPDTVQADLQIQREGASAVDWFHATLGYGAMRAILTSSTLAADTPARFLVRGTNGSLFKRGGDRQEGQLASGLTPGAPGWGQDPDPLLVFTAEGEPPIELVTPPGDYPRYYVAIRDAILHAGPPPVTPLQACAVMAVLESGIRSAETGRVVRPEWSEGERAAWEPVGRLSAPFWPPFDETFR
jgi:predicted dehydrogenase